MENPPRLGLALAVLMALTACGTPQEQCIARNTRDLRTVESLIKETEGNLARGFGYRTETRFETVYESCLVPRVAGPDTGEGPQRRLCPRLEQTETRVPVSIDLETEARKLSQLRAKRQDLQRGAERAIAECRAAYPE